MPPTKILIATIVDEFKILAVTYRRAIDREVLEPDSVCGLLVVPREVIVFGVRRLDAAFVSYALPHHPTPSGLPAWGPRCRATAPLRITQFKQSALYLNHAAHILDRSRRGFHRRVKLITKQMLDVVNQ